MRVLARRDLHTLRVHFGRKVDPRSVERVIRAIGSVFGRAHDENEESHDGAPLHEQQTGLEVLEIQLTGRADANANEAFYALLTSILPGLSSLRVIRMHCAAPSSGYGGNTFEFRLADTMDTPITTIISEKELDCVAVWRRMLPHLNCVEFFSTARWTGVVA
jgi:hypothetical protein